MQKYSKAMHFSANCCGHHHHQRQFTAPPSRTTIMMNSRLGLGYSVLSCFLGQCRFNIYSFMCAQATTVVALCWWYDPNETDSGWMRRGWVLLMNGGLLFLQAHSLVVTDVSFLRNAPHAQRSTERHNMVGV